MSVLMESVKKLAPSCKWSFDVKTLNMQYIENKKDQTHMKTPENDSSLSEDGKKLDHLWKGSKI